MSTQGQGDGGVYLSANGPCSYGFGGGGSINGSTDAAIAAAAAAAYEEQLIIDCMYNLFHFVSWCVCVRSARPPTLIKR
jgi:hypothetical protein